MLTIFLLGPLASLAALQLAVCVSSRVNDARSAQQVGALIILPISVLLVAEFTNDVQLTSRVVLLISAFLAALNAGTHGDRHQAVRSRVDPDTLEIESS